MNKKGALTAGILLAQSFVLGLPPAFASVIDKFDIKADVAADGSLHIKEDIIYNFEGAQKHGIVRLLPLQFNGQDAPLNILKIESPAGHKANYTAKELVSAVQIKVGDKFATVTGIKHYHLEYDIKSPHKRLTDGIMHYTWSPNGRNWEVPIKSLNVAINLPAEASIYTELSDNKATNLAAKANQGKATLKATALGPGVPILVQIRIPAKPGTNIKAINAEDTNAPGGGFISGAISAVSDFYAKTGPVALFFIAFLGFAIVKALSQLVPRCNCRCGPVCSCACGCNSNCACLARDFTNDRRAATPIRQTYSGMNTWDPDDTNWSTSDVISDWSSSSGSSSSGSDSSSSSDSGGDSGGGGDW